jgi:signal transduction histidine kinase
LAGDTQLPKLMETLMTIALENAGADRGLLILPHKSGYRVEVAATAGATGVGVTLMHASIIEAGCPETLVNYVLRTAKMVILDDTTRPGEFSEDPYLRKGSARSVFCLPLLRQASLTGVLYLENTRAAAAFTPDRVATLDVLAAQAAISLETARLYTTLQQENAQRRLAEEEIRSLNQELEERVRHRTAQLEAVNKELEAFAYSVSHDLRAPLRHIDGFLHLLEAQSRAVLDQQSRNYMETIYSTTSKMGQLIHDLLSFSRVGRQALAHQRVAVGPLVREIVGELAPDTAGRRIDWRIGELPSVRADAAMLRLLLVNLMANAVKYTRPRDTARIEIGSQPGREGETVVFVRDNGVGFDPAYADKLFGVFKRLHPGDEFEGTGIGLANVRRIAARHGGRTWAEGELNQGACFYFSLPPEPHGDGD